MRSTMFLACIAASLGAAGTAAAQAPFARPSTIEIVWQAPVGHFQPRASDIPIGIPLSPSRAELEARDRELDEKLKICRGC
jgi:hypothetical protein